MICPCCCQAIRVFVRLDSSDGNGGGNYEAVIYVAIPGDADLNGDVDVLRDAFTLVQNLGGSSGQTWADGDFDGDGDVDVLQDAFILVQNLGASLSSVASLGQSVRLASTATFRATESASSATVETDAAAAAVGVGLPTLTTSLNQEPKSLIDEPRLAPFPKGKVVTEATLTLSGMSEADQSISSLLDPPLVDSDTRTSSKTESLDLVFADDLDTFV